MFWFLIRLVATLAIVVASFIALPIMIGTAIEWATGEAPFSGTVGAITALLFMLVLAKISWARRPGRD
jgi:hypothetical protein